MYIHIIICKCSMLCLPNTEPYNSSAGKGKQMMIGGSKSKTAFVDGYFEKKFDRIMEVISIVVFCHLVYPLW